MEMKTICRTVVLAFAATLAVTLIASPAAAQQPDALDLLPDAAELLPDAENMTFALSVDVRAIGEVGGLDLLAEAYPLVLRQLERPELVEKLDFDITTDLHSLAFAAWLEDDAHLHGALAVASGRFNSKAIIEAIQAEGEFPAREIAGYDMFLLDPGEEAKKTYDTLLSVTDNVMVMIEGTDEWVENAMKRLAAADRAPSPAARLLDTYEGMIRIVFNARAMPADFWITAQKYGPTPENLVSFGLGVSLEPVEQLVTEVEVKAVLDTIQKARDTHLAVFGGIETAKQWVPMLELLFDRTALKCEDTAVSMTADFEPILLGDGVIAGVAISQRMGRNGEAARRTSCINNQKQICMGLVLYVDGPGENQFYPQNLKQLYDEEILGVKRWLICPADPNAPDLPEGEENNEWYTSYETIFDLTDIRLSKDNIKFETMVIWDKGMFHNEGRVVGFGDSSVRLVSEEEFQQMLRGVKEMLAGLEE